MDRNGKRRNSILRHIEGVIENCNILAEKLIEANQEDLAHKLIANSLIHDNSKFFGIEWSFLHREFKETKPELFEAAVKEHRSKNPHHIEYWGNIKEVPTIYLIELVADITARANEFGQDIRVYLKDTFADKYGITTNCAVYREILRYVNLLLDKPFKN